MEREDPQGRWGKVSPWIGVPSGPKTPRGLAMGDYEVDSASQQFRILTIVAADKHYYVK